MTLADKLKEARKNAGFTQIEFNSVICLEFGGDNENYNGI